MAYFKIASSVPQVYLTVAYTVGNYSIANNTTPVTVSMSISHWGINTPAGTDDCKLWIGDQSYKWTGPDIYQTGSGEMTKDLGSHTFNVPHNSEGKWSGKIGASYRLNITYGGSYIGTISGSEDLTLPTIPRASSFSVGTITIGSEATVTIHRASSNFTHTVEVTLGNRNTKVTGAATSAKIKLPLEWCNAITNSTTVTATMVVTTYNGSSKLGTSSKTVSLAVPTSVVPSVSAEAVLVNGFQELYLQGRSKVTINSIGTGAYGSTIKSYSVSGAGYTGTGNSYTTGILNLSGTVVFTVTAVDSRGRSASTTVNITVIGYNKPMITVQQLYRCTTDGKASEEGTSLYALATFEFSSVNGLNAISATAAWRKRNHIEWQNPTAIISDSGKVLFEGLLDITNDYEINLIATDAVGESASTISIISSSANYLFAARQGIMGLLRYPDLTKDGVQVGGNLHIDGTQVDGPVFALGKTKNQVIDDFNNYLIPGTYAVSSSANLATIANRPPVTINSTAAGVLMVRADTGSANYPFDPTSAWIYVQQIWIPMENGQMYTRFMRTGDTGAQTFTDWTFWPPLDSRYVLKK